MVRQKCAIYVRRLHRPCGFRRFKGPRAQSIAADAMDTARRSSITGPSPTLNDDLHTAFKRWYPAPWEFTTLHLRPCRRKAAPHRNVRAGHRRPRTSRLCVVSAGTSAPRPSLGAWAPKPITVNHRPRQFFARACNRDGVINPANSLERSLRGTQNVAMLGGVVALEREDDNVFHLARPWIRRSR